MHVVKVMDPKVSNKTRTYPVTLHTLLNSDPSNTVMSLVVGVMCIVGSADGEEFT